MTSVIKSITKHYVTSKHAKVAKGNAELGVQRSPAILCRKGLPPSESLCKWEIKDGINQLIWVSNGKEDEGSYPLSSAHIHSPAEHFIYKEGNGIKYIERLGELELHLVFAKDDSKHYHAGAFVIRFVVQKDDCKDENWVAFSEFCKKLYQAILAKDDLHADADIRCDPFHQAMTILRTVYSKQENVEPMNFSYVGSKTTPLVDHGDQFVQNVRFHFAPVWKIKASPDQIAAARAEYFSLLDFAPQQNESGSSFASSRHMAFESTSAFINQEAEHSIQETFSCV